MKRLWAIFTKVSSNPTLKILVKIKKIINLNGTSGRLIRKCKRNVTRLFIIKLLVFKIINSLMKKNSNKNGNLLLIKISKHWIKNRKLFNTLKMMLKKRWNLIFFAINAYSLMFTKNSSNKSQPNQYKCWMSNHTSHLWIKCSTKVFWTNKKNYKKH